MITQDIVKLLNEQIAKEMFAANLYLSMSSWCYENSFDGAGLFLFQHADEESGHAKRLITYLNETDSKVIITEVATPESNFNGLLDVFEKTYAHEQKITQSINNLVDCTLQSKDYPTFNFLQWYVSEQHEEEALFRGIVDKIKLIGSSGDGLYLADRFIKDLTK
ncbi:MULTISPECIES: non-heme ferritin [Helicobacter]|uniref:Ferritin n=1 Tax=Helicobacter equorum TaxID=361872 RepID=A0A3D8IN37_9HELI|nr:MULTISPECIES: non-heme ferritin [Helicobacter]MCI7046817.1 non-heme ferritin [Helicobacter sp.]MCL9820859.1 non-heme ferritin [Helicobacter colisuis]MDY5615806.1 non-heme ferritin [Helicobacter sp.]RDU66632.1 non-heme ferritin [Helicobacter equorum]